MSFVKFTIPSPDAQSTLNLAAALAYGCQSGDCILLRGDLGAGKTTFARGFIKALRPKETQVISPTFSLVQTYLAAGLPPIWHFDLYRLNHEDEATEIGLDEALRLGITLIEWPELVEGILPGTALDVTISIGNKGQRSISFIGAPMWQERLEALVMDKHRRDAVARHEQIVAFLAEHGYGDASLHPLAGDASFRRYIRIRDHERAAMLMDAPPGKENVRPFMAIARYLRDKGYSAPAILAHHAPDGLLLLEDLGDDSFTVVLRQAAASEEELYTAAIDLLAEWHDKKRGFANRSELPLPDYDLSLLMKEVGLFTDWYLPQALGADAAAALKPEYEALWSEIFAAAPLLTDCWVHRDYHADNLMWLPSRSEAQRVGLLDFQDGLYGDPAYDLVSLLEDARRDVPKPLAEAMLKRYLAASGADRERFMTAYAILGAQRNSKIIGIFSRLAVRDGKTQYLSYLPRVWRHLENDVRHPALATLKQWLDSHSH